MVIHGTRWSKIAQVVGTRNGDQCWKRWYDCLDPQIDKSPWTPEEVSGRYLLSTHSSYTITSATQLTLADIQGRETAPNGSQARPKLDRNRQQTLPKTNLTLGKKQIQHLATKARTTLEFPRPNFTTITSIIDTIKPRRPTLHPHAQSILRIRNRTPKQRRIRSNHNN